VNAIECATNGLTSLSESLGDIHLEAIANAPVSRDRIGQIEQAAAEKAFSKSTGGFPVTLFSWVSSSTEVLSDRHLTVTGLAKGEFIEDPIIEPALGESGWFATIIRAHVASSVFAEVMAKLKRLDVSGTTSDVENAEDLDSSQTIGVEDVSEVATDEYLGDLDESSSSYWSEVSAASPERYWDELVRFEMVAERLGGTPILFIESGRHPYWVEDWFHVDRYGDNAVKRPEDMNVSHDDSIESENYMGHLNSIAVYCAPVASGSSVIMCAEALERVQFTEYPGHGMIKIEDILVPDEPDKLNLKFNWSLSIELADYPAREIAYGADGRRTME